MEMGCSIKGNGWLNFLKSAIGGPPKFGAKDFTSPYICEYRVIAVPMLNVRTISMVGADVRYKVS